MFFRGLIFSVGLFAGLDQITDFRKGFFQFFKLPAIAFTRSHHHADGLQWLYILTHNLNGGRNRNRQQGADNAPQPALE